MKVRYIGKTFGVDALTNGREYECLSVEDPFIRVIDDSEEDYLYSASRPAPLDGENDGGRWEIVEDNEQGLLSKVILL